MPAGRYLFIPFLRTKSQKRQTKNWSSEKSHKKKTDRTNIIATNFVWEQLKKNSWKLDLKVEYFIQMVKNNYKHALTVYG